MEAPGPGSWEPVAAPPGSVGYPLPVTRTLRAWAASFALSLALSACAHSKTTRPPYARGKAPSPEALLAAGAPSFANLKVPKAKIREGRSPAARLLLIAEAPERLLGTIEVAGNPLVSLSMHEEGYALRNLRDAPGLRAGFYSGPPSRCAVRSLLGVDMDPEALVRMLLGGAPLLDSPYEVVSQDWTGGREQLVLRNGRYEERVEFAWLDGRWWFSGASMYALDGGESRWLWTFRHGELRRAGDGVLPGTTEITRPVPGKRKPMRLSITWLQQIAASKDATTPVGDGDGDGGGDEDPGWSDEGWEDEGWEDEGEDAGADGGDGDGDGDSGPDGNDDADAAATDADAAAAPATDTTGTTDTTDTTGTTGTTGTTDATPEPAPAPNPAPAKTAAAPAPEKPSLPAAYRLEPAGLPNRGDLCR